MSTTMHMAEETPMVPACSPSASSRMPAALRVLGARLGGPFGGLSDGARDRLAEACLAFAALIEAGEIAPDGGVNLRPWPRFLLSALFALELTADALAMTEEDEAWLIAEVEADLGEARALLQERRGEPRTPVPPRPPLPVSRLIRP